MDLPTCACAALSATLRALLLPVHLLALLLELALTWLPGLRRARPAPPRHALVAGAASGMGRALAVQLARGGVRALSLADVDAAGLAETRRLALLAAAEGGGGGGGGGSCGCCAGGTPTAAAALATAPPRGLDEATIVAVATPLGASALAPTGAPTPPALPLLVAANGVVVGGGGNGGLVVAAAVVDVRDRAAARAFVEASDACAARGALDLALAVAGTIESRVAGGRGLDDLELGARAVAELNVGGVLNVALPALERMRARGAGRVGVLSSAAARDGFSALYPAYAASKSFATAWALGLRARLRGSGVALSVFEPGAVRTPLLAAPAGLDARYDLARRGPACAAHLPCVELSPEAAARAWLAGMARDEAVTRPHLSYGLCAELLRGFPLEAHDLLARARCGLLWGWRPPRGGARHAWVTAAREQGEGAGAAAAAAAGNAKEAAAA